MLQLLLLSELLFLTDLLKVFFFPLFLQGVDYFACEPTAEKALDEESCFFSSGIPHLACEVDFWLYLFVLALIDP